MTLHVRWLGRVPYREALAVQHAMFGNGRNDHLLLLEHPHVFTHGQRADLATNVLVEPASVNAELVSVKRGGDVTYHGPGQLVGYPIVNLPNALGAADHVCTIQRVLVATLQELGVDDVGCLPAYPGVWVGVSGGNPRKIAAIGVRLANGRTMHGFALNVCPDMRYLRDYIVPCGIADKPVTSLVEEGVVVDMQHVVDVVARHAAHAWGEPMERQDVAWKHRPDDLAPLLARRRNRQQQSDRTPAASRRQRRSRDCDAQTRVAAAQGKARCGGTATAADRSRTRIGYRLRRGWVPKPQRLLGRRHRDIHGVGRSLYTRMRVLPRRYAQATGPCIR